MEATHGHYGRLAAMLLLSFLAMYTLMYAMVDVPGNVYPNHNQAYMAGLMTAPMAIIEIVLMRSMYPNRRLNAMLLGAGVVVLALCWSLIRDQAAIGDRQFLKSMIPHHAAAVLMCKKAPIDDAEVEALCRQIVVSQETEIRRMKEMLARMDQPS